MDASFAWHRHLYWITMNCGHTTLVREEFLQPAFFGHLLLCHQCAFDRDV